MSHREREIVPDGGTNERQGALPLKILASVGRVLGEKNAVKPERQKQYKQTL